MQIVVDADLQLLKYGHDTCLHINTNIVTVIMDESTDMWKIEDKDHTFVLDQATIRSLFKFEITFDSLNLSR